MSDYEADDNCEVAQRETLHRYLTESRDYWETYHARKENSVWLAVTAYLAALGVLTATLYDPGGELLPDRFSRLLLIIGVMAAGLLVSRFVSRQLEDRGVAGDTVAGLGLALAVVTNHTQELSSDAVQPTVYAAENGQSYVWPRIACALITQKTTGGSRPNWNYAAPLALVFLAAFGAAAFTACWPDQCRTSGQVLDWLPVWPYRLLSIVIAGLGLRHFDWRQLLKAVRPLPPSKPGANQCQKFTVPVYVTGESTASDGTHTPQGTEAATGKLVIRGEP